MNLSKVFAFIFLLFMGSSTYSQEITQTNSRLKIYLDCQNTWCDQTFIRTEINIVDFLLDRLAADVHILITTQRNGNGGNQYQMIYYGQHQFEKIKDSIRFNTGPNATEFEIRDELIKYLKLGLVPFIIKTGFTKNININMKRPVNEPVLTNEDNLTVDPWNYWVFRTGVNGNTNGESIYKSTRYSGDISAQRTTEEIKIRFEIRGGKNKAKYEYTNDSGVIEKFVVNNSNYSFEHSIVKSLSEKWSAGYELGINNSTFSNNKLRKTFRSAIEYNIFPYKLVNSKSFTFNYGLFIQHNNYYDTTIYNKIQETLTGHFINTNFSFNRKWGNLNGGIEYKNFFKDINLNNLRVNMGVNVRVTGGLSFSIHSRYNLVHDQVFLQKGGATEQEILTRRRQLQTNFNYGINFGINYRFGSNLNNFINPRFENN